MIMSMNEKQLLGIDGIIEVILDELGYIGPKRKPEDAWRQKVRRHLNKIGLSTTITESAARVIAPDFAAYFATDSRLELPGARADMPHFNPKLATQQELELRATYDPDSGFEREEITHEISREKLNTMMLKAIYRKALASDFSFAQTEPGSFMLGALLHQALQPGFTSSTINREGYTNFHGYVLEDTFSREFPHFDEDQFRRDYEAYEFTILNREYTIEETMRLEELSRRLNPALDHGDINAYLKVEQD